MVFKKSLEYKFNGYQLPAIPQVPQSAKRKRSSRKKVEDDRMCAFDLLAAVAGKLLDKDDSPTSGIGASNCVIKHEELDEEKEKLCKDEGLEQVSCSESTCLEVALQRQISCALKGGLPILKATASEPVSATSKCDASVGDVCTGELIASDSRNQSGYSRGTTRKRCSTEGHYPSSVEHHDATGTRVVGNVQKSWSLEHSLKVDAKSPALVSSDSSIEVPLLRNSVLSNSSFPKNRGDRELAVNRDDDENSSGCTHPSTMSSKALKPQHVGIHKIRKLFSNTDVETKTVLCSRKFCCTRQRTQRSLFKRRKVLGRYSILSSGGGFLNKGVFNSTREETNETAKVTPSSASGQMSSYASENFHVKFSIRSFKVPELFIEIPETATVGSLKRTVVEAVTAVLGGGLHVGVLLQGKKVKDDNKTLLQAGISHGDRLDNLGFVLEPNSPGASPPFRSPEDPHSLLPCDASETVNRLPGAALQSDPGLVNASSGPLLTPVINCSESDHGSDYSSMNTSFPDKTKTNSRALIAVPQIEALSVVPSHKPKRSELAQRRIRRPFSVSEVEALVQAVEKLGTGRWRDVKLRAFDNAKHRTYVDLKDKWKTLVHTARISPQQRRGEPVPQELLDRVLAAHAHWSQQQAKLQVRSPTAEACLLY